MFGDGTLDSAKVLAQFPDEPLQRKNVGRASGIVGRLAWPLLSRRAKGGIRADLVRIQRRSGGVSSAWRHKLEHTQKKKRDLTRTGLMEGEGVPHPRGDPKIAMLYPSTPRSVPRIIASLHLAMPCMACRDLLNASSVFT